MTEPAVTMVEVTENWVGWNPLSLTTRAGRSPLRESGCVSALAGVCNEGIRAPRCDESPDHPHSVYMRVRAMCVVLHEGELCAGKTCR